MKDQIYEDFLESQEAAAIALAESTDLLRLARVSGAVPNRFLAEFFCAGLVRNDKQRVVEARRWAVGIWLPPDYLRRRVHVAHILTYLGPELEPWHPNISGPCICMNIQPGMELTEILFGLFDLFTWRLFATHDALNPAAAQWARNEPPSRIPVDRRPLKWRQPGPPEPALSAPVT
jgi:hypothetical protein